MAELLKEIAPRVTRAAVIRDPRAAPASPRPLPSNRCTAALGGVEPGQRVDIHDIERGLTMFARSANGGLIVTSGGTGFHRNVIIPLPRLRLPSVYPYRYYSAEGGLISYGPERTTSSAARPATSIASSGARSRATCPYKRRPNRVGYQPQDRQGARHRGPAAAARPR